MILAWTAIAIAVVAAWAATAHYAFRHYPNFGCRSCNGSGRKYENVFLALLCFRFTRRAWGPCKDCSGTANYQKTWWLSR